MASRSIASELLRQLDSSSVPLYLFDEERRLVFANRACADWTGVPVERLVGQIGSYTSTTHGQESAPVDRLCPPPEVFGGQPARGFVYAVLQDGRLRRRSADFHPLDQGRGAAPVLVVCGAANLGDDELVSPGGTFHSRAGADDDPQLLHDRVARFHQDQRDRYRLDRLVGDSPAMQVVRAQVRAAIASRANVTVVGPPGSGREHLARLLHYSRGNGSQNKPAETLVPLDCRVLTDEVLAAAADALSAKGRTEAATVLLLHLETLPREIQPELVRLFLHRFPNLRLLSTSNAAPDVLGTEERLHVQLAAALNTLVVRLPPLSERRRDIPLLTQQLIEELNARGGKQLRGCAPEAMDALVSYAWPGNLQELRDFVTEAYNRAEGTEITFADLPRRLSYAAEAGHRPTRADETIVLEGFLAGVERELIARALKQARGNKARAARFLGLTRPRLYRRMVQLGMEERPVERAVPPAEKGSESRLRPAAGRRSAGRLQRAATSEPGEPVVAPEDEIAEFVEDIPFEEQPD